MSSPAYPAVQPILNWAQGLPNGLQSFENGLNRLVPDSVLQYLHLMGGAPATPAAPPQNAQIANEYANQRLSDATAKRIRERAAKMLMGGQ